MRALCCLVGALSLVVPLAQAQEEEPASARYEQVTELEFDGLDVHARGEKPWGIVVDGDPRVTFPPMISFRTDFDVELVASADLVK